MLNGRKSYHDQVPPTLCRRQLTSDGQFLVRSEPDTWPVATSEARQSTWALLVLQLPAPEKHWAYICCKFSTPYQQALAMPLGELAGRLLAGFGFGGVPRPVDSTVPRFQLEQLTMLEGWAPGNLGALAGLSCTERASRWPWRSCKWRNWPTITTQTNWLWRGTIWATWARGTLKRGQLQKSG